MNLLKDDVKNRPISFDEFEVEKRVFVTRFMNNYDNVLECALISAKTLALTKQTFSENSERLNMEVLSNKDANKVLNKILDFNKMVVIYLGKDIDVSFDDLLASVE